jgi:hypothetical protein
MKKRILNGKVFMVFSLLATMANGAYAETELERLKREAAKAIATLQVTTKQEIKAEMPYDQTYIKIDTGVKKYTMRYKTFHGEKAKENPSKLSDWCSGYGMVQPTSTWYSNGFIWANLKSTSGSINIGNNQGKIKVLKDKGSVVGYDICFDNEFGNIVVRTIAIAGKKPLFIAVYGKLKSTETATLATYFNGYPGGFKAPHNRCVFGEKLKVENSGKEKKSTTVEKESTPWLLLDDLGKPDCLGIIFNKETVGDIKVEHRSNYAVRSHFTKEGSGILKQGFIVYEFIDTRSKVAISSLKKDASHMKVLFKKAFTGLPHPFEK